MTQTYTMRTMEESIELKVKGGHLYINGTLVHGALTWLWDTLVMYDKPVDIETTGLSGVQRRYKEALLIRGQRQ